jgi:hypothetical protein
VYQSGGKLLFHTELEQGDRNHKAEDITVGDLGRNGRRVCGRTTKWSGCGLLWSIGGCGSRKSARWSRSGGGRYRRRRIGRRHIRVLQEERKWQEECRHAQED